MRKIIYSTFLTVLVISSANVFAQSKKSGDKLPPPPTVAAVDLKQYAGKWFEIARYPNKFQKKCVGNTTASYALKPDGNINVLNECLVKNGTTESAAGEAKVVEGSSNAKLEVRFAPRYMSFLSAVWGDYWIVDLDKEYKYAAVGDPKREYLWILSRTPVMSDATYQNILRRVETLGFNPAKLQKTTQNAETVKGAVISNQ